MLDPHFSTFFVGTQTQLQNIDHNRPKISYGDVTRISYSHSILYLDLMLVRRNQFRKSARLFAQPPILRVQLGLPRRPPVQLVEGANAEHSALWCRGAFPKYDNKRK